MPSSSVHSTTTTQGLARGLKALTLNKRKGSSPPPETSPAKPKRTKRTKVPSASSAGVPASPPAKPQRADVLKAMTTPELKARAAENGIIGTPSKRRAWYIEQLLVA